MRKEMNVKDSNGYIVCAKDLSMDTYNNFKKGEYITIHNDDWTFYALVECKRKSGNRYFFVSDTYGHTFMADLDTDQLLYYW